ncbi:MULTISPECIES: hypothetical protein [unclassified Coleofasciculus]|nr:MULTISPECIES: hypothetical protein [unclassified Coleofasciculus]MBE9128343.1 hypothetical protein [Coleofasciculus sp. LEGE 07081]MBE9151399.1 hypothetical protein [Coleofasciculus sp. LEGE 07092]
MSVVIPDEIVKASGMSAEDLMLELVILPLNGSEPVNVLPLKKVGLF